MLPVGSGTDLAQHLRRKVLQQAGQLSKQRLDVLQAILASHENDDCQWQFGKILLKLEVPVRSDERIELRCRQREKLAVLGA